MRCINCKGEARKVKNMRTESKNKRMDQCSLQNKVTRGQTKTKKEEIKTIESKVLNVLPSLNEKERAQR